jgi:hypothetical protein
MRHPRLLALAGATLLAACSALQYHPGDGFAETLQFAEAAVPAAQLDVARMYADPDAYPASHGRAADRLQAAKWCYIVSNGPPAPPPPDTIAGASCSAILAATSPQDRGLARMLARNWLAGPLSYIDR